MREIISVHVGNCGNQMGIQFWQSIAQENLINSNGELTANINPKLETYFSEGIHSYKPRAIFVDLDPQTSNYFTKHPYKQLFSSAYALYGQVGTGYNWPRGHFTDGAEIVDIFLDFFRKLAEETDSLQGYQISHSMGGGTGSGMGTLILSKIREEFPTQVAETFSVFPSSQVSDSVVEPYCAVLSVHQLIENADIVNTIDNEAIANIYYKNFGMNSLTYGDLNHVICYAMTGVTYSYRHLSALHSDQRKANINLSPFPALHFFTLGMCPIYTPTNNLTTVNIPTAQLIEQILNPNCMLCQITPMDHRILSAEVLLSGKQSQAEADLSLSKLYDANCTKFSYMFPYHVKSEVINSDEDVRNSMVCIENSSSINCMLKRLESQFSNLFKKKAYLKYWSGEGMDEMEFIEAESNLSDLIEKYEQMAT